MKKVKIKTIIVSHLCRHFNQHQQLLNADPQALALYSFRYHGPFFLIETAQQLCKAERDTGTISAREKHLNSVILRNSNKKVSIKNVAKSDGKKKFTEEKHLAS